MDFEQEQDLLTRVVDAEGALMELVRLKDGPRDAAYKRQMPVAWSRARAVLTQIPYYCIECHEVYAGPCARHTEA